METGAGRGRGVAIGSSDVAMATRFAVSEAMSASVFQRGREELGTGGYPDLREASTNREICCRCDGADLETTSRPGLCWCRGREV